MTGILGFLAGTNAMIFLHSLPQTDWISLGAAVGCLIAMALSE